MVTKLLVDILVVALPFLYAGLVTVYGIAFFGNAVTVERLKRPYMLAVLVLHIVYLGLRTVAFDHPPITSVFDILTLLSAAMTIA